MWYDRGHESSPLYPTVNRKRASLGPGRIALLRCLCVAPLPNFAGIRSRRTGPSHRQAAGVPQTDGAQCHPRLQCRRARRFRSRILASPSSTNDVLRRGVRGAARPAPPQPPRLWQTYQSVDAGACSPGQLRTRPDPQTSFRRERAPRAQTFGHELEARQTLDHQPRPTIPTKKTHAIG